jgi:hypothetical protein
MGRRETKKKEDRCERCARVPGSLYFFFAICLLLTNQMYRIIDSSQD